MYEYVVVTSVAPKDYHRVCRQYEEQNFSLHESNHYRIPAATHRSLGSAQAESRWDLVFRKASKDISYGQMLINRYGKKLEEVADTLERVNTHPAIVKDIRDFLFQGSPSDM